MAADIKNIECEKNRRFELSFEVTKDDVAMDFSTFDVKMEVKKHPSAVAMLTFTEADGISIQDNTVTLSKETIDVPVSNYIYDLIITDDSGSETIRKGSFNVIASVTSV